jgi:AcrR family transcriptional regulator
MTTTKRRPGRPPIPRERILQTALDLIDEDGPEALSLRALADRLSSSTATLYRHVSGRSELINLVIDRMIGEAGLHERDYADLPWDEACHRIATTVFETLSRHGNAARLLVDVVPTGPHGMAVRELLLGTLLRAGFPPDVAARTMAMLAHYVLGFAMQLPQAGAGPARPDGTDGLRGAAPDDFPHIASVAHLLPRPLPEEFAFGLDLLLTALSPGSGRVS